MLPHGLEALSIVSVGLSRKSQVDQGVNNGLKLPCSALNDP